MTYRLVYHHAVAEEDLSDIPANVKARIARAIATRLITNPEKYGTPLKRTLKGYWKLRVGDYRVVYRVRKEDATCHALPIALGYRSSSGVRCHSRRDGVRVGWGGFYLLAQVRDLSPSKGGWG